MLKAIKLLFFVFLGSIISFGSILFWGIKIDSFSFGNINVSQFYIKLDKKLIVDIEKIEIKSKKSKVKNSFEDLSRNLELLPKLLTFFKSIHIEKLKIDGNEFIISLNEDNIYLDNKFINLSTKFAFLDKKLKFDLYSLYLKDYSLTLNGKINVDYVNEKLKHEGNFFYKDIEGKIKIDIFDKYVDFSLNTEEFKNLKFLKSFFRLPTVAEEWMYDNVKGEMKLEEFYGRFDYKKQKLLENKLYGKASINNAKIKFNKDLDYVNTKKIDLIYKKDTLSINLIKPKYKTNSLKGSSVVINNLSSAKNGIVHVNIKSISSLNKDILEILNTYDINLPLEQKEGLTKASLKLSFPYDEKKSMFTKGEFLLENSLINLNGFEFYSKKGKVLLDDTLVRIVDTDFKHKKMIDAKVSMSLDVKTLIAQGEVFLNELYIGDKENEILNIRNKNSSLLLKIDKDVFLEFDSIKTKLLINDKVNVEILDLKEIYEYSKVLQDIPVKEGSLNLTINDEENIDFSGLIGGLEFPIEKDNKKINSLNILGKIRGENLEIKSKDEDIIFKIKDKKEYLFVKNIKVLVDTKEKDEKKISLSTLNIDVLDSILQINKDEYSIKEAKVKLNKEGITFTGIAKDLKNIPLRKENKIIENIAITGFIYENKTYLKAADNSFELNLEKNKLDINLDSYDIYVDLPSNDSKEESNLDINIKGKNSKIILNKKFTFLSDKYDIRLRPKNRYIHLNYKKMEFTYKQLENGKVNLYGNDINAEYVNAIFNKNILDGGKLLLLGEGNKENIHGKLIISNSKIDDLALINNLLLFIHTSPALINPLLAIPSVVGAAKDGFSLSGYSIKDGVIEYTYKQKENILDLKKFLTIGNGIDFDGKGKLDLNNNKIESNIKLIFFKDYSSVVGAIPVVNYVLLGKDKRVETKVNIFGELSNPKISTNFTKDAFSVPVNIAKRVLTSPIEFVKYLNDLRGSKTKENKKSE